MSLLYIVGGDYGQVVKLTFIDVDTDAAADISSYSTTIQMLFTDSAGTTTAKTATFDTDGTDGVIKYTVEASFLTAGEWKVRGRVASGTARLSTLEYGFTVVS